MTFDRDRPVERAEGDVNRPSGAEVRRRVAALRRYRPLVRLLALPGISGVIARRLKTSKPVVRWLVRTGYDRLTAAVDELADRPPATRAEWRRVLEDVWPPPPPEFWELFDRVMDEGQPPGAATDTP